jgi:hypothetical protein
MGNTPEFAGHDGVGVAGCMQKVPLCECMGVAFNARVERFTLTGALPVLVTCTVWLDVCPGLWTTLI